MKKVIIIGILNALSVSLSMAECSITDAVYTYDSNPSITARFLPLKHQSLTNVYFTLTSSTGQNLWFTFDWGNGYTTERLVSSKTNPADDDWKPQDPDTDKDRLFSDLDFFAFDKTLAVSSGKIKAGESSPAYIFIPGLAPTLWYLRDAKVFSDYQLPRAMFKLSECKN